MIVEQRIWEWLPARKDRRRSTVPAVIAVNLNLDVLIVTQALHHLEAGGHAFADHRGSWHRGKPLNKPADSEERLWD